MSYTPTELSGICGMMPAFSTPDAADITATRTVDVENLQEGVDRVIKDGGVDLIATTGSFGECYNLFWDEFQTLVRATIETVNKRVPLMLGVTSTNPRETYQKMKFVREAGGEGVLLGLPYYDPLPVRDVPTFYRTLSELFPELSIMVYHNPENHRAQLYPYYEMGVAGCWSYHIFQGPWPIIALRDAAFAGDAGKQRAIIDDLRAAGTPRPNEFTDYVNLGPQRLPFAFIRSNAEEASKRDERAKQNVASWAQLCEKYRPEVEARRATAVAH